MRTEAEIRKVAERLVKSSVRADTPFQGVLVLSVADALWWALGNNSNSVAKLVDGLRRIDTEAN